MAEESPRVVWSRVEANYVKMHNYMKFFFLLLRPTFQGDTNSG